jgi:hypothetical protein
VPWMSDKNIYKHIRGHKTRDGERTGGQALFEGARWSSGADLVEAEVILRARQVFGNMF